MKLTISFLDAGVLIAATRTENALANSALALLDDPTKEFATSEFLRLEVLPKSLYYGRAEEAKFYTEYFHTVLYWANDLAQIVTQADVLARRYGLAALDALHIAAAISVNADEFVTTEQLSKPLYRVQEIAVVPLLP